MKNLKMVTETQSKVTLFDTNGKEISVLRKEIITTETTRVLGRKESQLIRDKVQEHKKQIELLREAQKEFSQINSKLKDLFKFPKF